MGINFDIKKHIGTLSTHIDQNGIRWSNEINIISWLGGKPCFDIREWDESHNRMRYGVKLDIDEIVTLSQVVNNYLEAMKNEVAEY